MSSCGAAQGTCKPPASYNHSEAHLCANSQLAVRAAFLALQAVVQLARGLGSLTTWHGCLPSTLINRQVLCRLFMVVSIQQLQGSCTGQKRSPSKVHTWACSSCWMEASEPAAWGPTMARWTAPGWAACVRGTAWPPPATTMAASSSLVGCTPAPVQSGSSTTCSHACKLVASQGIQVAAAFPGREGGQGRGQVVQCCALTSPQPRHSTFASGDSVQMHQISRCMHEGRIGSMQHAWRSWKAPHPVCSARSRQWRATPGAMAPVGSSSSSNGSCIAPTGQQCPGIPHFNSHWLGHRGPRAALMQHKAVLIRHNHAQTRREACRLDQAAAALGYIQQVPGCDPQAGCQGCKDARIAAKAWCHDVGHAGLPPGHSGARA